MRYVVYIHGLRGRRYLLEDGTFAPDKINPITLPRMVIEDQGEANMVASHHRAVRQIPVGVETVAH